jgi:hypothetical protein
VYAKSIKQVQVPCYDLKFDDNDVQKGRTQDWLRKIPTGRTFVIKNRVTAMWCGMGDVRGKKARAQLLPNVGEWEDGVIVNTAYDGFGNVKYEIKFGEELATYILYPEYVIPSVLLSEDSVSKN